MEYPSLDKPTAGAFRFNTDSNQLEIYDGNQWTGVVSTSPELETGGTRALNCLGSVDSSRTNTIDYINTKQKQKNVKVDVSFSNTLIYFYGLR